MPNHLPGRRTVLLAGLAGIAGCTIAPPAGQQGGATSGGATSPTPGSDPSSPSPSPSTTPTGEWRARVMTYNVLTGIRTAADFNAAVPRKDVELAARAPVMARWITTAGADIIALQENEANSPAELPIRALAPLLPGFGQLHAELEVPIMFRESAFRSDSADSLLLSKKFYIRYLSWSWFTHLATGGRLLVANTHLDPFQRLPRAKARSVQVDRVISQLGRLNPGWKLPMVLLGDLNTRSDETRLVYRDALVKLPKAGLRNAARVAAKDVSRVPRATSKNDFGTEINGTWRYRAIRTDAMTYDYAFVSPGIAVRNWQVVTGPGVRRIDGHPYFAEGPVPSDHCPVQVELRVEAKG